MGGLGLTLHLLLLLFALVAAVTLTGAIYQWIGAAKDRRRFPAPGRLIDAAGAQLHIHLTGQGSPPVVFEAGIAATSLSWRLVESETARFTTAVCYDRAGLGWSGAPSGPRDVWHLVEELRALLDKADISLPRILVAHSYGALIARAYAARYKSEVAGIVLVDPVPASQWSHPSAHNRKMLGQGIVMSRFGAVLARLGLVRFALNRASSGSRALPQSIARATSGGAGLAFIERMIGQIRKLPAELLPVIQSHWCDPRCFDSMARYLEALPANAAAVEALLVEVPLRILSAEDSSPAQREDHRQLAERSASGEIEVVPGAGHWIQLDRPDVVTSAIRSLRAEISATS